MTRVAALYDVHGNLPGLEAALADARQAGAGHVVIGGDVIPGPMPAECLALLRALDLPLTCIRGNGEREVLAQRDGIETGTVPPRFRDVMRWVADQLDDATAAWLASWPATATLDVGGTGRVLFCHATPRSDLELFTRLTPEARIAPAFAGVDAPLVICGHTHMPFDRAIGATRVVNAGSVGMPFGEPGASWALLGPGVALRHTAYDTAAAAARIRASAYPHAEDFAANNVVHPPSAAEMLERFTAAAGR